MHSSGSHTIVSKIRYTFYYISCLAPYVMSLTTKDYTWTCFLFHLFLAIYMYTSTTHNLVSISYMILTKLWVAETTTHNFLRIMQLIPSKLWVVYVGQQCKFLESLARPLRCDTLFLSISFIKTFMMVTNRVRCPKLPQTPHGCS